jgi:hypothetical protein
MSKIKLTDRQQCKLEFTHVRGCPATLHIVRNPLTGDWLQTHVIDGETSAYYSDKKSALGLANNVQRISHAKGLPCSVTIAAATLCNP